MMSFAAVLELVTIVAYVVVLAGGRQKRENGWRVLSFLLVVVGLLQCASMAIVVRENLRRVWMLLTWYRHTCSIMTTDSSLAGSWTSRGFFAQFLGALRLFRLL